MEGVHIMRGITALTHQEGRNNTGLPGHDASCTGHSTAQPSTLPAALSPQLNQL